ncbi:7637_t:CDS:1, partial [Ambispora leptoticha]
ETLTKKPRRPQESYTPKKLEENSRNLVAKETSKKKAKVKTH